MQRIRNALLARGWEPVFVWPIVAGAVLRFVFVFADNTVGPDEANYLQTGYNFWHGKGFSFLGEPNLHFPPLLPIILGAMAKVLPNGHSATQLFTWVTGVALIPILGLLAYRVAGRRAGLLALWIGALTPGLSFIPARDAGGSESPGALIVFCALLLAVGNGDWTKRPTWKTALGCGVLVGLAYLMRPESILVGVIIGLVLAARIVGGRFDRSTFSVDNFRRVSAAALAMIVGVGVLASPYVAFLHKHSGHWELTGKSVDVSIDAWHYLAQKKRVDHDAYLFQLDETGTKTNEPRLSLSGLARENPRQYVDIIGTNLKETYKLMISPSTMRIAPLVPGWRLFALPLLPFAFLAMWRRRSSLIVLGLIGVFLWSLATVLGFFVLNRYLVPTVACLTILAAIGLADLRTTKRSAWIKFGMAGTLVSVATCFAVPNAVVGIPREEPYLQLAGEWVKANIPADKSIMTRGLGMPYYAPNRLLVPPTASIDEVHRFALANKIDYLVFDPGTQVFRPTLLPLMFGDHSADGYELVHESTKSNRVTRIFKIVPKQTT